MSDSRGISRIVIYTCITRGYDSLLEPTVIVPWARYIYFSERPLHKDGSVWEFKHLCIRGLQGVELSRYPKLNPHLFFDGYDYSVYIDANLQIIDAKFYSIILSQIESNVKWGGVSHPINDCVYKEAEMCVRYGKASYFSVRKQMNYIRKSGFPQNEGLLENNIILRKHNDPVVIEISTDWWEMFTRFAKRDQLSLQYIFWEKGFVASVLPLERKDVWSFCCVKRNGHKKEKNRNKVLAYLCVAKNRLRELRANILFKIFGSFYNKDM